MCRLRPDADLQTLPQTAHVVLSGCGGTVLAGGLRWWLFIWLTYPALDSKIRPQVSHVQFAEPLGKFSMFPFRKSLLSFALCILLLHRDLHPFLTSVLQAARFLAVSSQLS